MAKQTVQRGATSNDGTGDTLRDGAGKINDNFNEIYVALGDGSSISQNTATLVSNAHLTATYATNTAVRAIETSLVAVDAAANTLIRDRMQVANTTALVNDRLQVANAQIYLTVANAQSYLEVANSGIDGILQLGNTTARDLTVGSITAAGDGNFTGNLTSFDLHANVTVLATDTNGNSTVLTIDNRNTVGNSEILISQNGNKRLKLQFSNQEFGIFANVGPANSNTPTQRRFATTPSAMNDANVSIAPDHCNALRARRRSRPDPLAGSNRASDSTTLPPTPTAASIISPSSVFDCARRRVERVRLMRATWTLRQFRVVARAPQA